MVSVARATRGRMLMMLWQHAGTLGVGPDNGSEESGCWLEPARKLQVVQRRGGSGP
jgi:hypothetical protein